MEQRTVQCVKLGRELPGLDESTSEGRQALKMALLLGGRELQQRVRDQVSAQAWKLWTEHMVMVINEYRLDPASAEADAVLHEHMVAFLFGQARDIPNYVPPPGPPGSPPAR